MSIQTIDKGEPKWGKEGNPQPNTDESMRFGAKYTAKRAIFDTTYSFVRDHFANGEGFDPDDVIFNINPAMLYQIDKEHQRSRKRVKLSED